MKKIPLRGEMSSVLAGRAASSLIQHTRINNPSDHIVIYDAEACGVLVATTPAGMVFLREALRAAHETTKAKL